MSAAPIKLVSWNIAHRDEPWRFLVQQGYDVALLQEAAEPPADVAERVRVDDAPWEIGAAGMSCRFRSAVVGLSDRIEIRHLAAASVDLAGIDTFPISRRGTVSAAELTVRATSERLFVVSMYGFWESHCLPTDRERWIFADASVHRIISDISALIPSQGGHRIIAAGDLNVVRGYGEHGSAYWGARYATVFDRMDALGLPCVGPELAVGAELRTLPPAERPKDSRTVPTFRVRIADPASATRQLDFVFASRALASRVRTRALDAPEEWGPSDHCRVEIDLVPDEGTGEGPR